MMALQLLPLALLVTALMLIVAYFMREAQHARHVRASKRFMASLDDQFTEGFKLARELTEAREALDVKLQDMRAEIAMFKAVRDDLYAWGEHYPSYIFDAGDQGEGGGHVC
jgi:hypothetical protein